MRQPLNEFDVQDEQFEVMGEERGEAYGAPDRRFPKIVLSLLAMVLFAGGLWFAYHLGTRNSAAPAGPDGVPLIRADRQPNKVKPDEPGGMKIPDQNVSIYDEKQGLPPVEKLLPAPEQPLPRPAPAAPPPAAASPPAAPAPAASMPPPVGEQANPVAPAAPAPAASQPAVPEPAAAAGKPAPAAKAAAPEHAAPVHAARPGAVQVRLGSLRSPEAARSEWARLKRNNPDLLGKLTAVAVRTDLGDKGIYYRIEAGPFADQAAAERLCSELKQRKLGCILAR